MSINQMVIDLSRCVGCGTCAIACKLGNNTQLRDKGQSFNWADFVTKDPAAGTNKWMAVPVKCNHCTDPKCVQACPVAPTSDSTCVGGKRKAMYKLTDENGGLVLHDDGRCISCYRCQRACPYSVMDMGAVKAQFSVISHNASVPNAEWTGAAATIPDCTSSTSDLSSDGTMPYGTDWTNEGGYGGDNTRPTTVVEKCYQCYHRTLASTKKLPYCVQACPANARRLVVGATSFVDDEGTAYTGNSDKTWNTLADAGSLTVLAHGSNKTPILVAPIISGDSKPQTYYKGTFNK